MSRNCYSEIEESSHYILKWRLSLLIFYRHINSLQACDLYKQTILPAQLFLSSFSLVFVLQFHANLNNIPESPAA